MDKQKKGLADMEDGEFILNESGTFISTDEVEGTEHKPVHQTQHLPTPQKDDSNSRSSAGPEEKDFTD